MPRIEQITILSTIINTTIHIISKIKIKINIICMDSIGPHSSGLYSPSEGPLEPHHLRLTGPVGATGMGPISPAVHLFFASFLFTYIYI